MKCNACKEKLDERDILEKKVLSCWKCGLKRELTDAEKRQYIPNYSYDPYDFQYKSYYYEN